MNAPRQIRQHRFQPAEGACEILFVRHGESAPFVEGQPFPLVGGHADPPLHPDGRVQAQQVAERLVATGERISAIYVTTLTRTHETAAPLAERLGLEPRVEADLREVFLGEWEGGLLRKHVLDEDPVAVRMYAEERWDAIPGGEPLADFDARIRAGVARIVAAHPNELVGAVVHGGVIGQIMNIAAGTTGFRFNGADNASIHHVVVDGDRWIIRCFNDTSHLSPRFSTAPEPLT
ncbi:MAG: histidine phosphatase family protein [Ilumatobacteraceae bacterium]